MKLKKFNLNKVLVIGLGFRTGVAVSNFLAARGSEVVVSDIKSRDQLVDVISKLDSSIEVAAGDQSPSILDREFDLIVLSPGVPASIPLVVEAGKKGIPVISEIELASGFIRGGIIAVTGTDGKSTTVSLTGHILKELGFDVYVGGNIGIPLVLFADETTDDSVIVIELSSYQLETIDSFRPDVSAILNVTPDHLDRYNGMSDYFEAKLRITMNQDNSDYYIYNIDDNVLASAADKINSSRLTFSLSDTSSDIYYENGTVYKKAGNKRIKIMDPDKMQIMGLHNVQNAMASVLMVSSFMEKKNLVPDYEKIAAACCTFPGLEHRMEIIGEYEGRVFINDSKATTVGAVEMAVKSITGKSVLILGGQTKGDDYSRLIPMLENRIEALILIGESKNEFLKIFKNFNPVCAADLDDAVVSAMKLSHAGSYVLLSPACASFDMFNSYEHRGDEFKRSYKRLSEGEITWI